jgi:hypothetical protein
LSAVCSPDLRRAGATSFISTFVDRPLAVNALAISCVPDICHLIAQAKIVRLSKNSCPL